MIKQIIVGFVLLASTFTTVNGQTTQIIAHRGFWKTENNAQNSIMALQKAAKENFFGSELDIHITKDDVLVVYHDHDVNGILIETANYSAIKNTILKNGETLPTLKEYLIEGKKYPHLKLILEVKSHQDLNRENKAVSEIMKLVNELKLEQQVEYISFSQNICNEVKKQNPEALVSYLNGDLSPKEVKEKGWDGIDYNYKIFQKNPTWIKEANDLGLITNTWTVNQEEIMEEMINQKIQYISTDEPLVLKSKLNKM
ncbi:glycerophosphodiester phosphodiesterase family protein [Faecalibacter macacae]|uniref:Glycerophosphodiester phosphodiesterase n=1 Tax=Faecalibacter macacae TaxID=1859289 RepID=A0A3L9M3N6_9FLAO|nr:glycerophosphodiester phosphodiesterase family protein [Faecalibacter macacae]RLZ07797.1 glycerophosphodiester phosphodiesterase [Faecalibacter macacae]